VASSRRNLEIKFRQELGIPIYQFLLNYRTEYFVNLLHTTDRQVYEITSESGFNNCKNTSGYFKKIKDYTPLKFRKKHKKSYLIEMFFLILRNICKIMRKMLPICANIPFSLL
jgi:transcriptional regulator GlxA family with amidase domain